MLNQNLDPRGEVELIFSATKLKLQGPAEVCEGEVLIGVYELQRETKFRSFRQPPFLLFSLALLKGQLLST